MWKRAGSDCQAERMVPKRPCQKQAIKGLPLATMVSAAEDRSIFQGMVWRVSSNMVAAIQATAACPLRDLPIDFSNPSRP